MKEKFMKIRADLSGYWTSRTKAQKGTLIGTLSGVVILAALITFFVTRTNFVPLYTDMSRSEIGQVKENLDSQGVPNKVAPGGTSILVPDNMVDDLLVSLASEGYPESGRIDYSFFSKNAGFGMTDNEFDVLKLASMQTEVANLLKGVKGVQDAKVMITMPEQGVFINQGKGEASASIVLKTEPGYQFSDTQITALYNLVSKSIPNLSTDNIVITNQYFEYFDLAKSQSGTSGTSIADQIQLKKSVERDIQRQVQMMLGTLMGQEKVVVSVTTDIDFQQEQREENLVEPVDKENMEGIALSVQRITETYTGKPPVDGGTTEGSDPTDNFTNYAEGTTDSGDYERIEETINNEVNRIRKNIVESPYRIRDIGIQVMVEPPVPDDRSSMPAGVQEDIERILSTIVRTSIDKESAGELSDEQIGNKIVVTVQPFFGKPSDTVSTASSIPWWIYVIGGLLVVVIAVLLFFMFRKKRDVEEEEMFEEEIILNVEDINSEKETESTLRRKQLEKMAKDKPEEFAKLLRTWIAEE